MLGNIIAVIGALAAAGMNAQASLLQRKATGQASAHELFRFSLVSRVLANKLWLMGIALEVTAFFAQAIALYNGPLILVLPIMTTDLIFLFILLHFQSHNYFSRREWMAALFLVIGLSGLLTTANPSGGYINGDFEKWILITIIFGLIIASGALLMRLSRSINIRTAIAGVTAGLHFSLTATITKLVVKQLNHYGIGYLFTSWELYLLAIVGISSALTVQSMYGAGPLVISQPALEIAEVLVGFLVGIYVFSESIHHSPMAISMEVMCGIVLVIGIVLLAGSRRVYAKNT